MKYIIDNINSSIFESPKEIEAKTPFEAVKKAYPDKKISRDYDNRGNIVVTGRFEYRYGIGYRKYVYKAE